MGVLKVCLRPRLASRILLSQKLLQRAQNGHYICEKNGFCSGPTDEKGITVSRLMGPDDANILGNVHGGVILQLIEEAGYIITTRYCNAASTDPSVRAITGLVRVEKTDFHLPMHVGEVSECHAEVTYTSPRSIHTIVQVWAENILKGTKRLTNEAHLWYVPVAVGSRRVLPVPQMSYASREVEKAGKRAYERQKEQRRAGRHADTPNIHITHDGPAVREAGTTRVHTPAYSASSLIHLVAPSDASVHGYTRGGKVMKLMDECAGITAAKHCHTAVVTASLDTINFHKPVSLGSVVTLNGRVLFTSRQSMEVVVTVEAETPFSPPLHTKYRACEARFTFVSLSKDGRPQEVPQLQVTCEEEQMRFDEGRRRYKDRKSEQQ